MEIEVRTATLADEVRLELLYAEIDGLHHEALPQLFRSHEEIALRVLRESTSGGSSGIQGVDNP